MEQQQQQQQQQLGMDSDLFEALLNKALVSEYCERYDDMAESASELIEKSTGPVSSQIRTLFTNAYRHTCGNRRGAWRTVNYLISSERVLEQQKNPSSNEAATAAAAAAADSGAAQVVSSKMKVLLEYRAKIVKEIVEIGSKVAQIAKDHLAVRAINTVERILALKLVGDYYRYMAEVQEEPDRESSIKSAKQYYEESWQLATAKLGQADASRIGVALNYSVFIYELMQQPEQACMLAKDAFDNAINNLEDLPDTEFRESTLVLQIIRDNLSIWTSSDSNASDEGQAAAAAGAPAS